MCINKMHEQHLYNVNFYLKNHLFLKISNAIINLHINMKIQIRLTYNFMKFLTCNIKKIK